MVRRILIKGSCGAGKSTLSAQVAARLGVPRVELDSLHWGPNWSPASATELRSRVMATLDDERGWVVDGNYDSKLGAVVVDRAELIVWLDLPLRTKLLRLVRRTGRRLLLKEELWSGSRETLRHVLWGRDAIFLWAVRTHFRHRRSWPQLLADRPHVHLRSARAVEAWLASLPAS